MVDAGETVVI